MDMKKERRGMMCSDSRSFSKNIPGKIFYLPIDGGFSALYRFQLSTDDDELIRLRRLQVRYVQ
jgi:hypothetical protein